MKLVDVHAHLNDEAYEKDFDEVVGRIDEEMFACVCGGYDITSSMKAVESAQKYEKIFATVGVHPENADYFFKNATSLEIDDEKISELSQLAKREKVVGIGEIGLDYHYFSDKSEEEITEIKQRQEKVFVAQINLANLLDLPIVVHCRDALSDCLKILQQHRPKKQSLMHCYSGDLQSAQKLIEFGFSFSFGGVTTFKNAKNVQEVVRNLPMKNVLLETDCPYLCPEPYRGKRNEPIFVKYVADKIATLKGLSIEEVGEITTENACKIFGLKN